MFRQERGARRGKISFCFLFVLIFLLCSALN